jgi:hypothetical protein
MGLALECNSLRLEGPPSFLPAIEAFGLFGAMNIFPHRQNPPNLLVGALSIRRNLRAEQIDIRALLPDD